MVDAIESSAWKKTGQCASQ